MRWIETDTGTNVDISSATAIGVYTANADRLIICDVSIDAVAGAGDYVMYITRQIGGSGSAYVILPKTTMTAATGETAISGQSGFITVRNGDVLTCYVDGLAGDISTPDWTTRWFELAALKPATADRSIDVDASGQVIVASIANNAITAAAIAQDAIDANSTQLAKIDVIDGLVDAIKAKTDQLAFTVANQVDANALTGGLTAADIRTAIGLAAANLDTQLAAIQAETASILEDTGTDGVVVASIANNAITAAAIAQDAIDADAIKADAVTEIGTGVWASATRTLTQSAASVAAVLAGSDITIQRGDTESISLTDIGALTGYTKLWFTVKGRKTYADTLSTIQIEKTGGLLYLNGAATTTSNGSITVDDEATGDITVVIKAAATAVLEPGTYFYDVQMLTASGVTTLTDGSFTVEGDVTRAVA